MCVLLHKRAACVDIYTDDDVQLECCPFDPDLILGFFFFFGPFSDDDYYYTSLNYNGRYNWWIER